MLLFFLDLIVIVLGHLCLVLRLVVIELLDPPLDAAEMEGLVTLLAVPGSRTLEDWVGADAAVLLPGRQALNKVAALLGQVLRLAEEVLEVVLHSRFVLGITGLTLFCRIDDLHLRGGFALLLLVRSSGEGGRG